MHKEWRDCLEKIKHKRDHTEYDDDFIQLLDEMEDRVVWEYNNILEVLRNHSKIKT